MITIPSSADLLVAATSLVVLMICQWLISGAWLRNRRGQTSQPGPAKSARTEFHQAA
jgi:hypothetical protein